MWKAALAGAFALAMVGSFSGFGVTSASAQEVVVTEAQIGRLHSALRLTSAQEPRWYAVAARLRSLGRQQQQFQLASVDSSFVGRAQRAAGYMLTATAMQRLRAAAEPLIAVLTDEQKSAGRSVLQEMGVSF
jgi:hypothetical protein